MMLRRTLALTCAGLTASAVFAVSASAADAATTPRPATASASVRPDTTVTYWEFEGYYSDKSMCALEGLSWIGDLWGGGVVIDYDCVDNYEPGPLGPFELWLLVQEDVGGCPGAAPAAPTVQGSDPLRPAC